jgi:hypothetical protein
MNRVLLSTLVAASMCSLALAQQPSHERGTAEGAIKGKKVVVDYGRAELKNRTLDSLIAQLPEERVWRAGINEVTTLTTEGALSLGGKKVPAGKYSVYVYAPATGDWALLLNSDLGITLDELGKMLGFSAPGNKKLWPHLEGYNPNPAKKAPGIADKEVGRVTMKAGTANPAVDPFTISLKPSASGLTMVLAWGDKTWSAELQAGS